MRLLLNFGFLLPRTRLVYTAWRRVSDPDGQRLSDYSGRLLNVKNKAAIEKQFTKFSLTRLSRLLIK